MNIDKLTSNKAIIALLLMSVILVMLYFVYDATTYKNPFGDAVKVQNLNKYTKKDSSNKSAIDHVEYSLLQTINMNSSRTMKSGDISDAAIRDNTFSQEYNKEQTLHSVNFIVDIPSLKQSYDVSYQWVEDAKKIKSVDEYGIFVRCIKDDKKKIYKDFQCKDMFTTASKHEDPIVEFLPYSTNSIKVTYNSIRKALEVTIYLSAAEERDADTNKYINSYKEQVNAWIVSKKLKPSDYTMYYNVVHPSLY